MRLARCNVHYLALLPVICTVGWLGESNFVMGTTPDNECKKSINGSKTKWRCDGKNLHAVPLNMTVETKEMILLIDNTAIEVLNQKSLAPYAEVLTELYLLKHINLRKLEPGIFNNTKNLRTIYIEWAIHLDHIDHKVFQVHLPKLTSLKIINCGLLAVPYLGKLITDGTIVTVDFDDNKIKNITRELSNIRVIKLSLNHNEIEFIGRMAFIRSSIKKLYLYGNKKLTRIDEYAFNNTKGIKTINLSETSIKELPTKGLNELEELWLENTKSLHKFPPLNNIHGLKEAHLTYPYHCCVFKHPDRHDPEGYKKIEKRKRIMEDFCNRQSDPVGCIQYGGYHNNLTCSPEPNAFSPCEDIMGNWLLRIIVWFVAILAIVGNLAVIIVLVLKSSMNVPEFLMCNLAFSDLCMGIYLTMLATVDTLSIGVYFNAAIAWQNGLGCQVAGFLTVFSTELSVFTLMVMSSERYYTIVNVMYGRRLGLKTAVIIMTVGWFYAAIMAALPLFGISGYVKTSLCLPLDQQDTHDQLYLAMMLAFTCLSFVVIVICYGFMYCLVKRSPGFRSTSLARLDTKIARKMALLIFISFACWAPIAFFGTTALAGWPLINLTMTKYVLVFFYPLNSFMNPFVYVISTRQYREDAHALFARYSESRVSSSRSNRNPSDKRLKYHDDKARDIREINSPVTSSKNLNNSSQSAKNRFSSTEKKFDMKEIDNPAGGEVTPSSSGLTTSPT